ncbi:MAG TPA: hypothetical protein VHY20_08575 [Pirellulales bacterium]|jgi:hypothetical protein|nr:hypothetical protein [Pirellulales bacterium]
MEYDIERSTRHCAATGREFAEGEEFYSVVVSENGSLRRRDYAADAWQGPPPEAVASWKSRMPRREEKKDRATPSQLLLDLFHQLSPEAGQPQLRYVLALLMIRRRIFRLEETTRDARGVETLAVYCPRDEAAYQVETVDVDAGQVQAIQDQLSRLVVVAQP